MTIYIIAIGAAALVIAPLAFYAGKLLYQLKQQNDRQQAARSARITNITQSIQTIAMAMSQQQCNLSEGAIRLVNLLESLPIQTPPKCEQDYPALYELYCHVRDLPTHDQRKALQPEVRAEQDKVREEHEARLETTILTEIRGLIEFRAA